MPQPSISLPHPQRTTWCRSRSSRWLSIWLPRTCEANFTVWKLRGKTTLKSLNLMVHDNFPIFSIIFEVKLCHLGGIHHGLDPAAGTCHLSVLCAAGLAWPLAERPGEPFLLPGSMKRCQVSTWALLEYQPSVGSQLSDKRFVRWPFLHPFTITVEETHGEAPSYLSRTKYINRVSWLFSSWLYLRSQQLVPSKLSIVLGRNVLKHCQAIGFIVFICVHAIPCPCSCLSLQCSSRTLYCKIPSRSA